MIFSIEGVDGVGKTLVAKLLAAKLGALYLKFPDRETVSGGLLDEALRGKRLLDPVVFQVLQTVNRLEKGRLLELAKGSQDFHVVCDRYTLSGLVYGEAEGLSREWLSAVLAAVPPADYEIVLTCDPSTLDGERLAGRDRERYEKGGIAALEAFQEGYLREWRHHSSNREAIWRRFVTSAMGSEAIVELFLRREGLERIV
jgi:dTMP kinase